MQLSFQSAFEWIPKVTRRTLVIIALSLTLSNASNSSASTESCYDLWYERNAIYDAYGYCFSTPLGRRTFDNSACHTSSPSLAPEDRERAERIRKEEKRRKCKVNG